MAKNFSVSYGMNRDCANPTDVCSQKDRFSPRDDKDLFGKCRPEDRAAYARKRSLFQSAYFRLMLLSSTLKNRKFRVVRSFSAVTRSLHCSHRLECKMRVR